MVSVGIWILVGLGVFRGGFGVFRVFRVFLGLWFGFDCEDFRFGVRCCI